MSKSRRQSRSHRPQPLSAEKHVADRGSSDHIEAPLPSSLGTTFPEFLTAVSTPRTDCFNLPVYKRHSRTASSTTTLSSRETGQKCSLECLISDFPCIEPVSVGCTAQSATIPGSIMLPPARPYKSHNYHSSNNSRAGALSHDPTAMAMTPFATSTGIASHHWPHMSISSSSEGSSSAANTTNPSPTTSVSTAPFDSPTANQSPCSVSDGSFFIQQQESAPSLAKIEKPWSGLRDDCDGTVRPLPSLMLPLSPENYARQVGDCAIPKQGERMSQGDTSSQSLQPSGQSYKMPAVSAHGQQRQRQQSISSACSGISAASSPAASPCRKSRRNIKKLTINTPGVSEETSRTAFPTALRTENSIFSDSNMPTRASPLRLPILPLRRVSAPASPSAMRNQTFPISEGDEKSSQPLGVGARRSRRRPTNLTIQTPRWDSSSVAVPAGGATGKDIPPTPSQNKDMSQELNRASNTRKYLHHYKSSPSVLPSPSRREPLTSTAVAERPEEEMMAEERDEYNGTQGEQDVHRYMQPKTAFFEKTSDRVDETYSSSPLTRESHQDSPRGYPNGPVCIYDEGLYLYLEPEVEDISSFDVVVNVAEEVRNPYSRAASEGKTFDKDAVSTQEYIHVPWSHSSEILQDLYPLCQFIESRIRQSKRVLIHCQLGVSRSASLVIAYGLFKNPDKDFNEMYKIVKERSEWVGPNLGLIYQLMDFRGQITRGNYKTHPELPQTWFEKLGDGRKKNEVTTPPPKPADVTESQRPTESISPPFIKTTFFANDDPASFDEVHDPPSLLSHSSSPPPPTSFVDLALRLRRSSHTSKPLPLREKFEKPTVGDGVLQEFGPTAPAPPPRRRFAPVPPTLSLDRQTSNSSELGIPAIGQVLKQGQYSPLAPSVDFKSATGRPMTSDSDDTETEVARATTILASPRTREFSRSQGPPATSIKARRTSLTLAAIPASVSSSPSLSAVATAPDDAIAPAAGLQGDAPPSSEEMYLFEDPRSPPPRSTPNICQLRESASTCNRPEISVGVQQRMEQLQAVSSRIKPITTMKNINEFL